MSTRSRGGGGGRQFPVGRRRYVPVADAGCGCRPRRPRLLSLPSFLKPCRQLRGGGNGKAGGGGEQYSCGSTSTASSSSSSAATRSTGYSSAYSSDYYQHQAPPSPLTKHRPASPARAGAPPGKSSQQLKANKKARKKKRHEKSTGGGKEAADGAGVGVAVEKESSDPRADFRDSMVQMVVEMGLCDWDGLRGMLRRLLALNAPRHHAAILTAFAEVCTQLAGPAAAAAGPPPSPPPLQQQPSPPPAYAYYHQYRR